MINFLKNILEELGLYLPKHSKAALVYFRKCHPNWKSVETRTMAREDNRYVVAVFYEMPNLVAFPMEYQLIAVSLDCRRIEELPTNPDSPYWIFGRK